MKIALVTREFPYSRYSPTGGIGTYAQNLTLGLSSLGHKVFLITQGIKNTSYFKKGNVTVINGKLFTKQIQFINKYIPNALLKRILAFIEYPLLFNLGVYLAIRNLSRSIKVDIIEGCDFGGELFLTQLLIKSRPPTVIRLHTPSFVIRKLNTEKNSLFYTIMKFLEIYTLKNADSLYSPSRSLAKILSKVIKRKINTVIPYPFQAHSIRQRKKTDTVIFVGKLQPKKGVFDFIRAIPRIATKIPTAKFILSGPDTLHNGNSVKKLLIHRCAELNILNKVKFYYNINKNQLYNIYGSSKITVIPSKWENFPNVCLEAMINKSLVIANQVGGLAEIIEDKSTGIHIDTKDAKKLASKIIEYLKYSDKRQKIITRSYMMVKLNYAVLKVAKKTVQYYNSIINKAIYSQRGSSVFIDSLYSI